MKREITTSSLLKYALPSIFMVFIVSFYEIIDGFYVSNFVGATYFAGINLIMPIFNILGAFGMMIGLGGSTIIGNTLGKGENGKANKYFSLFVYTSIIVGMICAIIGVILSNPLAQLLHAENELYDIAVYYGKMNMISMPAYVLEMSFFTLFSTAGKPKLGMYNAILSCIIIVISNTLLVVVLHTGLNGAIFSIILCEYVGATVPLIYFSCSKNSSNLKLLSPKIAFNNTNPSTISLVLKGAYNGLGEAIVEISSSVVIVVLLYQINTHIGEIGIIAYGVIEYTWIILNSFFLGFVLSVSPVMSFQQGANNRHKINKLFKTCIKIVAIASIIVFIFAELFAPFLVKIFVNYDPQSYKYSVEVFRKYVIAYLFSGTPIYITGLFISLGFGGLAAINSFARTIIFQTGMLIIFPIVFGPQSVWFAVGAGELLSAILSVTLVITNGNRMQIFLPREKN